MAKSKKKAEAVFLVCKETGDYNYTLWRKPGGEKLTTQKILPPAAQAHRTRREEKVEIRFDDAVWPRSAAGRRKRTLHGQALAQFTLTTFAQVERLRHAAGIPAVVAQLLVCRVAALRIRPPAKGVSRPLS